MALRQLLGLACLAFYFLSNSVGVFGVGDHLRGLRMKSQDLYWNVTGHVRSAISAASMPSKPSTPAPRGRPNLHTTSVTRHPSISAGAVVLENPQRVHLSVLGEEAVQSSNRLFSSTTFTSNGVVSLFPTHNINHVSSRSRGSRTASPDKSALASASSNTTRTVWTPTAGIGHSLTGGLSESSISTWSAPHSTPIFAPASSGSAIGGSKNKSASLSFMAAASKTVEIPNHVESLHSVKNRTDNRTRQSTGLGSRPIGNHPVRLPFSRPGIEIPPLAMVTGSNRTSSANSNVGPLGTVSNSALNYSLAFKNESRNDSEAFERPKLNSPSIGLPLPDFNVSTFNRTNHDLDEGFRVKYTTNCSGLITSTAYVVYETVTSTILVNETITLGPNATQPLPVFITPPPACQLIIAPCKGLYCPSGTPTFGQLPKAPKQPHKPSTITSTLLVTKKSAALVQQLTAVGNLFGPSTPIPSAVEPQPSSDGQQSAGQKPGPSNAEMFTQSDTSSPPESDDHGQSPKVSMPQQSPPNNSPPANSNSQNSGTPMPAIGSNSGQSANSDDDTASTISGSNGSGSHNGATSNNRDTSSNIGSPSNEQGNISSDGAASFSGKASNNGGGPELEAGGSDDSHATQYVPSLVMAGNLPISIVSNAVIIGSHSVKAGSPPTTIIADGQKIAIQPSQILAQGKTIPIQAAVTPPPANSATIGNIPVVLRPLDVAIGSHTFEHGSSSTSAVYSGQTYSWDASHLIGPGTSIAFPSVGPAPKVTAGGQVFSVFPSQLQAAGKVIPLPSIATASPFVYKSQTFSVNPSQIIVPDTSITLPPVKKATPFIYIDHSLSVDASHFMARSTTLPLSSGSGIVTYNGQVLTIKPSEIIGPSTTVALSAPDDGAASPTAVTTGGLTFSIGPSAAVVGSVTYAFVAGKAPATIITHGEAVLVGTNGVQFKNVHVPVPTGHPNFSIVTHGEMTLSIAPSKVVIDGRTDVIHSDMTPITTVVNGRTMSIGPNGVGFASTTIPLPAPKPSYSMTTEGNMVFSLNPSEVVVEDKTYSIASNKAPITTNINGRVVTLGPKRIHLEGTTVNLPTTQTTISVTAAGISLLVGATNAVISGTTYAIGSEASLQTVVVGSQTIEIGSAGVMLPSTTIAPEQTPSPVTAGGLTLLMDSTQAVISGTTYAIGRAAGATTIVADSVTMVLGTNGIALPSTTIRPLTSAPQTGFSSVPGVSGGLPTANATRPLVPIATGRETDRKHAAGISTRISNESTLLGLLLGLGAMMLGLRGCADTVYHVV